MDSDPPPGAALLVAGYGWIGELEGTDAVVPTLSRIGETLLATAAPWRARCLSASFAEPSRPDRANLKRHLGDLVQEPVAVAMLVAVGVVTDALGEPAFVAGSRHDDFPEDATLPLSWIRERLRSCRAERVFALLSAQGSGGRDETAAWLRALATRESTHVVAVHAANHDGAALRAVLGGLCGEAIDAGTGTVTLRSMTAHLARALPGVEIQASASAGTLVHPPPLPKLWDLGLSHTIQASGRVPQSLFATGGPEDLLGVTLPGRFRIERVLAQGSFGIVYRARQLMVERDVAVKVLQSGVDASSNDGRLFVQEIQSVGRLEHPNVVRIYHADIAPDGRLFFAMELLVGRDLQQIITDDGTLEPGRATALTRQLLAGLGAAHDAGLVHADVKPANAFVVRARDQERLVLLDFGMARLRPAGQAAESAGGTPAYMAPEQLNEGRVDARSDLFSTALVLVTLLTGWRRTRAQDLVPPLGDIAGADLRALLSRALAIDPADRFQSAAEFADALAGKSPGGPRSVVTRPPFRHLAPLTEDDRGRLHGRDRDVGALVEHVLYRRAVIYTAPSGTGKTSLLRAGLVPRMESLGARAVYLSCRVDAAEVLPPAIWAGTTSVAEAICSWREQHGGKLVVILDQLENLLSEKPTDRRSSHDIAAEHLVDQVLAFDRWPSDADVAIVLSVREDFLARLIARSQPVEPGIPILRLGPLGPEGAREAIAAPLAEARLNIAPDLLDTLLDDLQAAATAIGPEMGWGTSAAVYPPHLQLACSVLHEALAPGEAELTLAHYRRLGGLDAIVGEYLDRVLETELDAGSAAVARDLFLALVTSSNTRAMRSEVELTDIVGPQHGADRVVGVLQVLHARGLVVRLTTTAGEPAWELVHDSLVPRVLGWIDRRDLTRRRAIELVRYHLRRSRPEAPSLLDRAELRELHPYPEAVDELELEWARRRDDLAWTPKSLLHESRRTVRRRIVALVSAGALTLGLAGAATYRWAVDRAAAQAERTLVDRDMGRFTLEISPFDWSEADQKPIDVSVDTLPGLRWQIHEVAPEDPDSPGKSLAGSRIVRGSATPSPDRRALIERVEARGGRAFLVVTGRGSGTQTCPPSIVPLQLLPGYAQRDRDARVRVRVPTCQATLAGTVVVGAGAFLRGGPGEPPPPNVADLEVPEERITLPAYRIDRTEVTNAAFSAYADLEPATGIAMPVYPPTKALAHAGQPLRPAAAMTWGEARAYCRFLGKELPTTEEWEKAMRGGIEIDGRTNPMPRRNLPWGASVDPVPAKVNDTGTPGPAPVGTYSRDVSPYGILDMAGNVQEWTATIPLSGGKPLRGFRIVRGANWGDHNSAMLVTVMAMDITRPMGTRAFGHGVRCVLREPESSR